MENQYEQKMGKIVTMKYMPVILILITSVFTGCGLRQNQSAYDPIEQEKIPLSDEKENAVMQTQPARWHLAPEYQHDSLTATECEKCVHHCLKELRSIKAGMTRQEVMRKFLIDGGIHSSTPIRFLHPQCRVFKVDVEFSLKNTEDKARQMWEPDDIAVSVSEPYFEQMFMD